MVDRVSLVVALARAVPRLPVSTNAQAEKALNKVVGLLATNLPLDRARALPNESIDHLKSALDDVMPITDLKKVSKLWDPKRTVPSTAARTDLARELSELLDGHRAPFNPTPRPLGETRAMEPQRREQLKRDLERFATPAQLKAVIKKWDRRAAISPDTGREALVKIVHQFLN